MSSTTTLKAVLIGEDRSMGRAFDSVGRKADGTGRKVGGLGSGFVAMAGKLAVGVGGVLAAGAAIGKFGRFLGDSVSEAREAEKVGKTTAQIIKSTGGAAKVSAEQVADLAEAISVKAGVDDEAIQSGANLLLTFKNVRNEAGQGAKVFDRATAAAVDLSAAGFGSVDSAAKMLGKALNDPLKGISALSRAGVTFTDQQKEQIKTLMKSGDVLGAQKIILGEVESQVGGVAAASSTMGEKMSVAWGNFKEKVGTALLPILDRLGGWFVNTGIPALTAFFTALTGGDTSKVEGRFRGLADAGQWLHDKIVGLHTWITTKLWPALKEGWQTILPGLTKAMDILTGGTGDGEMSWKKFGDIITGKVIPFIAQLVNVWLPAWAAQIRSIIEVVKAVWGAFQTFRAIIGAEVSKIAGFFAGLLRAWAAVLSALSNVPGFGWAKEAANKLEAAASKADQFGDAIRGIPSSKTTSFTALTSGAVSTISVLQSRINAVTGKTVTVRVRYVTEGRLPSGGLSYAGGSTRAGGGPVVKGRSYLVGENGPEIWSGGSGHITPARQTARVLAGGGSGSVVAGGGYNGPERVQLILDGRVLHEVLLRQKRQSGMNLGLA